jgi:hypothetical protein
MTSGIAMGGRPPAIVCRAGNPRAEIALQRQAKCGHGPTSECVRGCRYARVFRRPTSLAEQVRPSPANSKDAVRLAQPTPRRAAEFEARL